MYSLQQNSSKSSHHAHLLWNCVLHIKGFHRVRWLYTPLHKSMSKPQSKYAQNSASSSCNLAGILYFVVVVLWQREAPIMYLRIKLTAWLEGKSPQNEMMLTANPRFMSHLLSPLSPSNWKGIEEMRAAFDPDTPCDAQIHISFRRIICITTLSFSIRIVVSVISVWLTIWSASKYILT